MRLIASAVFIPCFILIALRGEVHFLLLTNCIVGLGMWEFYSIMWNIGVRPYRAIGILSGLSLLWYLYLYSGKYAGMFLTIAVLALMALEITRRDGRGAVTHLATTAFGVIYVGFLGAHLVLLRELPVRVGLEYHYGASFVFLAFFITWSCDTGAYFVGKSLGRRKILPRVSAGKTWEGAIGGVLLAMVGAVVARYWFADYLTTVQAVLLGAAAGIVGPIGDFAESMIKRDADIKDTSEVIPGHGGVLDRFDSLLFTAPLLYYFLKFVIF